MSRYYVTIDEKTYDIDLKVRAGRHFARVNGREVEIQNHELGETRSLLMVGNQPYEVDVRFDESNGGRIVFVGGHEIPAKVEDYGLAQLRKAAGLSATTAVESLLRAPMPGLIVDVRVCQGEKIKKGTPLIVIEAMKMENIIKAKGEATVKTVHVTGGQSVEKGDKLLELE
jgi:biotin carboxyl carrier protein